MGSGPFWIENWKTNKIHINRVEDWFPLPAPKKLDRGVDGWGWLYLKKKLYVWNFFNLARHLSSSLLNTSKKMITTTSRIYLSMMY